MRTIAIANLKGGVGKTTTAFNVAACLAEFGYRVLLVDADAQGCLSDALRLDRSAFPTLANVLRGQATAGTAAQPTRVPGLRAICATPALDDINGRNLCGDAVLRARRLLDVDFTIVDCPGHAGVVLQNALVAADEVICPVLARGMAQQGLDRLVQVIGSVRNSGANTGLDLTGIVISQFDGRTRVATRVIRELRDRYDGLVLETMIHESVRLAECTDAGLPVIEHAPASRAAREFRELARELVQRSAARRGLEGMRQRDGAPDLRIVRRGARAAIL